MVKRCGDGDPEAWRAFLPFFQEVGRRALRAFRLSPADADDIIADALASLYSGSLAHFRGGTTAELVGFLRTVVRNRAERYEAEGEEPGDQLYRRVANALGRALAGSADTQVFGRERCYQTAVA